jgi:Zn-dependent protease with chaperone function
MYASYEAVLSHEARAHSALTRAAQLGAPLEAQAQLEAWLDELARARHRRAWLQAGLWALPAWFALFGLLMLVGAWLSRTTLAAADRALEDPTGQAVGLDAWLRRAYAAVIAWSCAFFYMSIPLVLLVVLVVGGGLLYGMLAVGHMPIKLILIVAVLTVMTLWSVIRGLFARGGGGDPGPELDLSQQPRLRACLDEVATRIGTRAVDRVFLTPATDIAVFERRSARGRFSGQRERCLILGIGVLEGMTVGQWKAILAHEYGHFVNRDTAGGGTALVVRRSLVTMAVRMATSGAAGWFNPAWWFVRGFHAAFMRVSQGASRLQEILADRWASAAYGSAAFVSGLTHVISASVRFNELTGPTLEQALKSKSPLTNLYRQLAELEPKVRPAIDHEIETALAREPDPLDSHPAPRQRFAWAQRVATAADPGPGDERGAWVLLDGRDALEAAMTSAVRTAVEANHGIKFAELTGEPPQAVAPPASQ